MCSRLPLETHCLTVGELPSSATVGLKNVEEDGGDPVAGAIHSDSNKSYGGRIIISADEYAHGSGALHNNISPSVCAYIWKRTM